MHFAPTLISQLFVVDLDLRTDERGYFSRLWCHHELAGRHLNSECRQVSVAYNLRRGTLRGLHYQAPPHAEAKLVRVIHGAIHDVVLDVRPESQSFGQYFSIELTAANRKALYVPEGCAHGYVTLAEHTEVLYVLSGDHQPQSERGVHWQSPVLQDAWPCAPSVISARDQNLPRVWPPIESS